MVLALVLTAVHAMLTDYFLRSKLRVLRLALFAGWVILGAATLERRLVMLCPLPAPSGPAAAVELKYPELAERLTTTVELADTTDEFHGSRSLIASETRTPLCGRRASTSSPPSQADARPGPRPRRLAVAVLASFARRRVDARVCESRRTAAIFGLEHGGEGHKTAVPYDLEVPTQNNLAARGRPVLFSVLPLPHHDDDGVADGSTLVLIDDHGQETRFSSMARVPGHVPARTLAENHA